jgi:hypothetical protein
MIKSVLAATAAAVALAAPLAVQAQPVEPIAPPLPNDATNARVISGGPMGPGPTEMAPDINTAIIGQPQPGPDEYAYPGAPGYGMAPPSGYVEEEVRPISPRTTWIPSHYNWDPDTSNYVLTRGQFIEAPTATAQWIPGHWEQTPTAWIWINGGWR